MQTWPGDDPDWAVALYASFVGQDRSSSWLNVLTGAVQEPPSWHTSLTWDTSYQDVAGLCDSPAYQALIAPYDKSANASPEQHKGHLGAQSNEDPSYATELVYQLDEEYSLEDPQGRARFKVSGHEKFFPEGRPPSHRSLNQH